MPSDPERHAQFTRLFAECESNMQAFAFSLVPHQSDVDDIIQETLKALWEKFEEFDPDRPFLPWANRFVYRQVQMHRRAQANKQTFSFSEETFELLANDEPVSLDRDKAMGVALEKCLQKLSSKNRKLIEERYQKDGSLQDYAESLGQTANSLYKTLQRIRQ